MTFSPSFSLVGLLACTRLEYSNPFFLHHVAHITAAAEVRARWLPHTDMLQHHVCTPMCMQGVRHRPIVGPDLLTGPMFENTMVSRVIFSLFPRIRVTYTGDKVPSLSRHPFLPSLPRVSLYVFFLSSSSSSPLPLSHLFFFSFPVTRYTFYTYGRRGSASYGESLIGNARITRRSWRRGRATSDVCWEEKLKGFPSGGPD